MLLVECPGNAEWPMSFYQSKAITYIFISKLQKQAWPDVTVPKHQSHIFHLPAEMGLSEPKQRNG